nr:phosphoribosyltransferase family protein [Entomospira entomophilus]
MRYPDRDGLCQLCATNFRSARISNTGFREYCRHCSIPLDKLKPNSYWCHSCLHLEYHKISFSYHHQALTFLTGTIQTSIYLAKFTHLYQYKGYWSYLLYPYLIKLREENYRFVLAPTKRKEHLMDAIRRELSFYGIETIYTFLRKRVNIQQKNLDWSDRRTAQQENIYISKKNMSIVTGQKWLILDDIYTTGATLYQSAKVLHECGASEVRSISLSIAIPPTMKNHMI